jgi:hypothetical protein
LALATSGKQGANMQKPSPVEQARNRIATARNSLRIAATHLAGCSTGAMPDPAAWFDAMRDLRKLHAEVEALHLRVQQMVPVEAFK